MSAPTRYSIPVNDVNSGGATSEITSNHYKLLSTIGQSTPPGTIESLTSVKDVIQAGFIYARMAGPVPYVLPPLPIKLAVNGNVFLPMNVLPPGKPDNTVQVQIVTSELPIMDVEMYVDGSAVIPELTPVYTPPCNTWEGSFATPAGSGVHYLSFLISDEATNRTMATVEALVQYGAVQIIGTPLNYPNPFKPMSGDTTKIQYTLSADASIILIIYDISGHEIKRFVAGAGQEGGKAGVNNVSWTGKTIFGDTASNGMFVYKIISGGKVIGTGKLVVLD